MCSLLVQPAALFLAGMVACARASASNVEPLPEIVVTADNTHIDKSCRVVIPPGTIISDADGNGAIHVDGDGITIEFSRGSELRGAATPGDSDEGVAWDQLTGIGVRVDGHSGVVIRGAAIAGYKVGLLATNAGSLVIDGARIHDCFRQRLKSSPQREDASDWLWPHENDDHQWRTRYGAAICVESSPYVSISNVVVRRTQNGIILDRADRARVFDNDCSFLSGWGLALWRSSDGMISRNALDFCVRGHSEGVYNRGQDSAGILCFEQCSRNLFVENSVTHGGDGFFGFAGKEALGEKEPRPEPPGAGTSFTRRGCNENILVANDFSFAPAHGIEMTFSFDNTFANNTIIENGICGVWGGYSKGTRIEGNTFARNGELAYGLERGAINMEHAAGAWIERNTFTDNRCGVHLWWDDDGKLLQSPWAMANGGDVIGNVVRWNAFKAERVDGADPEARPADIAIHLRNNSRASERVSRNPIYANTIELAVGARLRQAQVDGPCETGPTETWFKPDSPPDAPPSRAALNMDDAIGRALGASKPVGARAGLAGRRNIFMGEWGPWDHESPMVRLAERSSGRATYEVFGSGRRFECEDLRTGSRQTLPGSPSAQRPLRLPIVASGQVHPYAYRIRSGEWSTTVRGTLVAARWDCRAFSWDDASDPRTNLEAWRSRAQQGAAFAVDALDFKFGHAGPKDQAWARDAKGTLPGADRFGIIARTRVKLPPGKWRITTQSDDGVRVMVDGRVVLENWTWHAPTIDRGESDLAREQEVEIVVEHFEIDGFAALSLDFECLP